MAELCVCARACVFLYLLSAMRVPVKSAHGRKGRVSSQRGAANA